MLLDGILQKIYDLSEWITKFMFVNLLWIVFTIAGLAAAGFFPATAAMFSVTREWVVMGKGDCPVFNTFWQAYKKHFVQSNLLGYLLLVTGLFLYVDLRFAQTSGNLIFQSLSFLFLFLFLIYFAVMLYIFPVFVHFKYKTIEYIKYSFVLAVGRPILTIMMIVASILVLTLLKYVPVLVIFVGGSIMSYILMWIAAKAFPKERLHKEEVV